MKNVMLAGAFAAAVCLAVSPVSAEELREITLCLDWTPNTNHTGFYAADALGYYEEAGLKVTIVQPPEDGASLMCASGQAEFAVDCQDSMAAGWDLESPLEVTAVAALLQHNTSGILSRQGDGITSPKGLEDKIYSSWELPIELAMLEYVMEQDGGDFSKVKLIPNTITDEPAALMAHQTDAVWVFYGWSGINAEISEVPVDFWAFGDLSPELDYYTPFLLANNTFLEEEPETAKAFLAATAKGYAFAIEQPREAAEYLMEGDDTGSLADAKELVYASQEYLASRYIEDAAFWGELDPERWDAFYGWLYEHGLTEHDLRGFGYSNDYLSQ